MARMLGVGIATLDIINVVAAYPAEDAEVRALAQRLSRGGNATNTLVVLSQLGHRCSWAGTLATEPDAQHIRADLDRYNVDMTPVKELSHGKVPTSYIVLSEATGSRTIVHHRDLPEYDFASFSGLDLSGIEWIHFEGRNVAETEKMLVHARTAARRATLSLELEKLRDGIERLSVHADVLLVSRAYCAARGLYQIDDVHSLLRLANPSARVFVAWGADGAYAWGADGEIVHAPAVALSRVVDTLGAGDTFNAGVIDALSRNATVAEALAAAVQLAGRKCGMVGFAGL